MAEIVQIIGVSGTGKSNLVKGLAALLEKEEFQVVKLTEPGPLKKFIKSYRLRQDKDPWVEAAMFATSRTILYSEKVLPKRNEPNLIFLTDRGFFDSVVYQGFLGGVDLGILRKMNSSVLPPDITIALTVKGDVGYQRNLKKSKEKREPISENEYPERIELLSRYYRKLPRHFPENNIIVIDTTNLTEKETLDKVYDLVRRNLNEK